MAETNPHKKNAFKINKFTTVYAIALIIGLPTNTAKSNKQVYPTKYAHTVLSFVDLLENR